MEFFVVVEWIHPVIPCNVQVIWCCVLIFCVYACFIPSVPNRMYISSLSLCLPSKNRIHLTKWHSFSVVYLKWCLHAYTFGCHCIRINFKCTTFWNWDYIGNLLGWDNIIYTVNTRHTIVFFAIRISISSCCRNNNNINRGATTDFSVFCHNHIERKKTYIQRNDICKVTYSTMRGGGWKNQVPFHLFAKKKKSNFRLLKIIDPANFLCW